MRCDIFSRMRSEGFLFLSGGLGAASCLTRFRGVWLLGAGIERVSSVLSRACVWTFCVAGVGNRGSVRAALQRGMAFRLACVGNGG